jgi:hypothetical protein
MKIGIIGAGQIGGTLTRRLTALGHKVFVANSRGPETLSELAAETRVSYRIVASCRLCSLIPGFGVKLSAIILAGPTVLSAVGACPPHDGVRRRWWMNVASAVSLIESSQKIGRSHHRHRPGRDIFSHCAAGTL